MRRLEAKLTCLLTGHDWGTWFPGLLKLDGSYPLTYAVPRFRTCKRCGKKEAPTRVRSEQ